MARDRSDTAAPNRLPRLFVDDDLGEGARVALDHSQVNYLRNVMRLGAGAELLAFNGRDGEWRVTVTAIDRKRGEVEALERTRAQIPVPGLLYCFAPLKHARLDYMVQKATEMGAGVLQPVSTVRTVADRVNLERMRANAVEAAEQCTMLSVPEIRPMIGLDELLDTLPRDTALIFCDESAPAGSPLEALAAIGSRPLAVLIGPEGGFDPRERERLLARDHVVPISLGPRIMRADTAAVATLAVVQATIGDWRTGESG